jgi:hypothetical protein
LIGQGDGGAKLLLNASFSKRFFEKTRANPPFVIHNFPRKLTMIPFFVAIFCFAMLGSAPNGHLYAELTSPSWMI